MFSRAGLRPAKSGLLKNSHSKSMTWHSMVLILSFLRFFFILKCCGVLLRLLNTAGLPHPLIPLETRKRKDFFGARVVVYVAGCTVTFNPRALHTR